MPYLHCPDCHRTAWVRSRYEEGVQCRQCGTTLSLMPGSEARYLTGAIRQRFVRESRLDAERPRFTRDPQRLHD